ncbi:MAG TPA: YafY family protein [Candidatus Limiplasma sp.]|nr:YafY family protein [Candidatus Limiplasma sp.]HRX08156.1 YafY family protein [Candidatus Limiplasma sp.]
MQIHRLFEIVYLLIERRTMTAKELAARLEVSPRTILRDIEVLSGAGIPLYSTRGRCGGIALVDGYVLSKAFFSESEQTGILAALQQLSATQYPDTQPVLDKLKGIFVKQTADWLEVDFTHWGSGAEDREKLSVIQSALLNKQALRFTYASAKGETAERLVYPLKLCFKSMSWYISAYCTAREDYRTFKLNRIQNAAPTDIYFGDLDLKAPPLHIDESTSPRLSLKLLFHPRQAHRVYDEFSPGHIAVQDDGQLLVTVAMSDGEWLYGYLLTYGPDLEVLEPPEIREKMAEIAAAVMANYR